MKNAKLKVCLYFILTYSIFCLVSLNRHSHTTSFNYHSEIFSDKAGYNVYLPALFIYDFNAANFPKHTDVKTGNGFILDSINQKIITKYPYGVALLESPFWLTAHVFSNSKDGYSSFYQKAIDFSGCFYLTLGLFFLFFIFRHQTNNKKSLLFSALFVLSSGIFYYGIFETGMSHIYSFCSLSIILYLLFNKTSINEIYYLTYLAIACLVYVVVRPINAVFLVPVLVYFLYLNNELYFNQKSITSISRAQFAVLVLIIILFIAPQLAYYKYAFGSFIAKSYQNESFETPTFSRMFEVLFSPNNGLLIYYPVCLLLVLYAFFTQNKFKPLLTILFLSYLIIYASWWSLSLGCSFGHRAFNDIFLLFLIPVFLNPNKIQKWLILTIILLAIVNFKFIFSYDTCLYTSLNWDFAEYQSILFGEFK